MPVEQLWAVLVNLAILLLLILQHWCSCAEQRPAGIQVFLLTFISEGFSGIPGIYLYRCQKCGKDPDVTQLIEIKPLYYLYRWLDMGSFSSNELQVHLIRRCSTGGADDHDNKLTCSLLLVSFSEKMQLLTFPARCYLSMLSTFSPTAHCLFSCHTHVCILSCQPACSW